MALEGDKYLGFDTIQRKTLMRLLEAAGDPAELQAEIDALEARVADLEAQAAG